MRNFFAQGHSFLWALLLSLLLPLQVQVAVYKMYYGANYPLKRIGTRWPGEDDASEMRCTLHRSGPCCLCALGRPRCPSRPARLFLSQCSSATETRIPGSRMQGAGRAQGAGMIAARTMRTGRKPVRCEGKFWKKRFEQLRDTVGQYTAKAVGDLFTQEIAVVSTNRRGKVKRGWQRRLSADSVIICGICREGYWA